MKKFEYQEIEKNANYMCMTHQELQRLGLEGWELVAITVKSHNSYISCYIFKREICEDSND